MKKLLILFSSLFLWVGYSNAQPNDIAYHSDFEKNVLGHFIEGKQQNNLQLQLIADPTVSEADAFQFTHIYNKFISEASEKKESLKSDKKFLSWLFFKVHRKTLKNYVSFSSLSDMFKKGSYDCLSATTYYALLLNDLGYNYEIVETNYHIYLNVITNQGQFLIESTDPIYGFVEDKNEIAIRLQEYVEDAYKNMSGESKNTFSFSKNMNDKVSLTRLAGLQYYNVAVNNFNKGEIEKTINLIEKSIIFYRSDRITEFGMLVAQVLTEDESLETNYKEKALNRVSQFIKTVSSNVASR